jgi:hypothetical protein
MGNVGYMCSDLDEIAETIEQIIAKKDSVLYAAQQQNIIAGMAQFSVENLQQELLRKLSAHGCMLP